MRLLAKCGLDILDGARALGKKLKLGSPFEHHSDSTSFFNRAARYQ